MEKKFRLQFKEMNKRKKKYFSKKDLAKIKRNTWNNNRGENYLFIAQKIKSKSMIKKFKSFNNKHEKKGYLDGEMSKQQYKLYKQLMKVVKKKSSEEYDAVYSRL
jgi:hypothetical protein